MMQIFSLIKLARAGFKNTGSILVILCLCFVVLRIEQLDTVAQLWVKNCTSQLPFSCFPKKSTLHICYPKYVGPEEFSEWIFSSIGIFAYRIGPQSKHNSSVFLYILCT
jgi:hypothetical protein